MFKTRTFARWSRKAQISDKALLKAVAEMAAGLVDADLGGSVYKKRVPLPGRGKSGGARILVATRHVNRWFLLYGFGKKRAGQYRRSGARGAAEISQRVVLDDARTA